MPIYRGFSTQTGTNNYKLFDFNLVKQDLINAFNIRKGEKLMNPDYGTVIWDLIFDPFDDNTKQVIQEDIKRIVASDPRIGVQSAIVTEYEQGIQIELNLIYIQTNTSDVLSVTFDKNTRTVNQLI